jgi:hypothetical protein
MAGGYCNECGELVRNEGHAKTCSRGLCSRCGGRFPRLADPKKRLCRDCAAVKVSKPPRHGAALICFAQGTSSSQITWWSDFSAALEADARLTPCGERCREDHAIAYLDAQGRIRTTQVRRPGVDHVHRDLRAALNGDGLAFARLRDNLKAQGGKHE